MNINGDYKMGENVNTFYKEQNEAILPTLRWTKEDSSSLWNLPFSKWFDYFALKRAKKKMTIAYASQRPIRGISKLAPDYIKAVQKGHVLTVDYLQTYGDLILTHFVHRHFRKKYGLSSKQWKNFQQKEEKLWNEVIALRNERKENFFKDKIMHLEKIPEKIRQRIIKNISQDRLRRALLSYYRYQDGEDRSGRRMPNGITPPPTSLIVFENPEKYNQAQKAEEKRPKKPLPPIFYERNRR